MRARLALLLLVIPAAARADCPRPAANPGLAVWALEAELTARICDDPAAPLDRPNMRIGAPRRVPPPTEGPGAGPWVLGGIAVAGLAGTLALDRLADEDRDGMARAARVRDRVGFAAARDAYADTQLHARISLGVGVLALAGSLLWFSAGETQPPPAWPTMTPQGAGVAGRF